MVLSQKLFMDKQQKAIHNLKNKQVIIFKINNIKIKFISQS